MSYTISVYLPILLILYTLFRIPPVNGQLTPWCGVIDFALVDRNYTTKTAIRNQKLCYQACQKDSPTCKSANYRPGKRECDLNCASHFDVCAGGLLVEQPGSLYTFTASEMMGCDIHPERTTAQVCNENDTPSCRDDEESEWQLVFKGVAGTGIKMFGLWTNTTWRGDGGCHGNYRNKILFNAWKNGQLNIKQVKLSLYNQTGVKVELVFNGTDSDILSWFAKKRLLSSPWSDLTTTATTNYFSIAGDTRSGPTLERRFYINRDYGGCPADHGWLVVVDYTGVCSWEMSFNRYPVILYSTHSNVINWHNAKEDGTLGMADYLTIHIDTK